MKKTKDVKKLYLLLFVLLIVFTLLSLFFGAENINFFKALKDIFTNNVSVESRILLYSRLPRTLAAILAGSSLSLAGVIIQSVLSNSLASPSTIGVNSGAGLFVVIFAAFFPHCVLLFPLASMIGAFLGSILVITIGEKTNSSKLSLVLAGVAVSAIFNALIDGVLTFVPDALNSYSDFRIGGLFSISMKDLTLPFFLILISSSFALFLHNEMDILNLGMEEAKCLGLSSKKMRIVFLFIASVLSGSAISFCGLIGFIGLIVPHIMRQFVGEESKPLMITSILGGAVLLLASDLFSRLIFAPFELPVGIILALIGGPFFIILIKKRGKVS